MICGILQTASLMPCTVAEMSQPSCIDSYHTILSRPSSLDQPGFMLATRSVQGEFDIKETCKRRGVSMSTS